MRTRASWISCVGTTLIMLGACADAPEILAPADVSTKVAPANEQAAHEYEVTIENLTSGQPLSPGVIATHTGKTSLFRVGEAASEGIRLIAENGDPSRAIADLSGNPDVYRVLSTGAPVHRVGGPGSSSLTVRIAARANANRISLAVMLVCSNDGFTGLSNVRLPGGFQPAVYHVAGYDAGTEANQETSESIVDGCGAIGPVALPSDGNARPATAETIAHHAGILGVGDLSPALHGWSDPVARITIQRIK